MEAQGRLWWDAGVLRGVKGRRGRSRVQPRGEPQEGICNGVQDSGCPGNIRKMYVGCLHPHRPEPRGMGHMEQGHSELFWVARALQLTPGTVI